MATPYIEHVNLTVSDAGRSAALMRDLFGWHVRWEGPALGGGRTIHVGDDRFYLALYAPPAVQALAPRLLLHATSLAFTHPLTGEAMRFESPAPF